MHSTCVHIKRLGLVTIRPLRDASPESQTLVAYIDEIPVGAAELVLAGSSRGEISVALADRRRADRVGAVLVDVLERDARLAGITDLTVTTQRAAALRRDTRVAASLAAA